MIALAAIVLSLGPWNGPSLPTANPDAVKYRLSVRGGAPGETVHLSATPPQGWVASFCSERFCAPFSYDVKLDRRGAASLEFQAIRTDEAAPRHIHFTVRADAAARTISI
jgi:hypothetical protein